MAFFGQTQPPIAADVGIPRILHDSQSDCLGANWIDDCVLMECAIGRVGL